MSPANTESSANGFRAVVLVGGQGTRLRPLTFAVPKPLIAVGDKPMLQLILEQLRAAGCRDVILATGYLSDLIKTFCGDGSRFGVTISYIHEPVPLGTAGPLAQLKQKFAAGEYFVLMNGDIISQVNFTDMVSFARSGNYDLTVGYVQHEYQCPYGVLQIEKSEVAGVTEKPRMNFAISSGIYVLKGAVLNDIPDGRFFTVPDLIEALRSQNRSVGAYLIRDFWLGVENLEDVERIRDFLASQSPA